MDGKQGCRDQPEASLNRLGSFGPELQRPWNQRPAASERLPLLTFTHPQSAVAQTNEG